MEGTIITLIFAIIAIIAHIIKGIRESTEAAKQQQHDAEEEALVIITRPKPGKQPKAKKQPLVHRQTLSMADPPKRQALSKKLTPQGEGERFAADPGTLDTTRIVASTIDPSVKPTLESITGIYDEGDVFAERTQSAVTVNVTDFLAEPGGIAQAVILAEILNQPAWQPSPSRVQWGDGR